MNIKKITVDRNTLKIASLLIGGAGLLIGQVLHTREVEESVNKALDERFPSTKPAPVDQ